MQKLWPNLPTLPNLSIILCDTFLKNFNYCDNTGKRANTSKITRFFFENYITRQIETLANETTGKIRSIKEKCQQDQQPRIQEIAQCMNHAIETVRGIRCSRGHWSSSYAGGRDAYGVPSYGGGTFTSKEQGKFERELEKALKQMKINVRKAAFDGRSGKININEYREAFGNISTEREALKKNRGYSYTDNWAD